MARLLEICVETVAEALLAASRGADRIELCAGLIEGGTTPSAGLLERVCADVEIPVVALIRPRAGDFVYSAAELDVMRRDVDVARDAGVRGVALGVLRPDDRIDLEATAALVEHSAPLPVTFHRAFDSVTAIGDALDELVAIGVARILTSGGGSTAREGVDALRELVARAAGRLTVIAAGSVRSDYAAALIEATGVAELHSSARLERAESNGDEITRLVELASC